jgi:mannose-6-phosphate isomerase
MTRAVEQPIVKLQNPIQHYGWGSTRAIAELQGRPVPSPEPEAELWIGDHPIAPSVVQNNAGDEQPSIPLSAWIDRDPHGALGSSSGTPGGKLPFLTKILAAAHPLSLQVHPDPEQARTGYAREEAAHTPSEQRCYRDAREKHEVLIALSPFHALCGLRADAEVANLVSNAGSELLQSLLREVEPRVESGFVAGRLLARLQRLDADERGRLCRELSSAHPSTASNETRDAGAWIGRLCAEHPGDPLVAAPLLMNCLSLAPREALVVHPGLLHTYLDGVGVEVMTPSDNVVRAGLSSKHVDLEEFRRIASVRAEEIRPLRPESGLEGNELRYPTGTPHFEISSCELGNERPGLMTRVGGRVSVLLCVAGAVRATAGDGTAISLRAGEAGLVPAATDEYTLETQSMASVFVIEAGAPASDPRMGSRKDTTRF